MAAPSEVNCVPGFTEPLNITVNEGAAWAFLSGLGFEYNVSIKNDGYDGIDINRQTQPGLPSNKHIFNIYVKKNAKIPQSMVLPIEINTTLPIKPQNPKNLKLNIEVFNITIDPKEIIAYRNNTYTTVVKGRIAILENLFINLKEKSNITGINIQFDPPQISTSEIESKMIIGISKKAALGKHCITVIGECGDKKATNVSVSFDVMIKPTFRASHQIIRK